MHTPVHAHPYPPEATTVEGVHQPASYALCLSLGQQLHICISIKEAHRGRLWMTAAVLSQESPSGAHILQQADPATTFSPTT